MHKLISKIFTLNNTPLIAIVLLALFLRLYSISNFPSSLNWDEVSHGYNAYSILTSGKDEWGNVFPTIFRAYGDYKLPVYIYVTSASVFLFGLTEFAVRLPSVLAGIGTVIFTYLLTLELFSGSKKTKVPTNYQLVPIIAALLVAIEPWSFFLSRGAFEANLALFFFVSGLYFFLRSIRNRNSIFNILYSSVFLGLTVWTYNSYRIFTPLMMVVLFVIYRNELIDLFKNNLKLSTYCILLSTFFFLPMFYQLLSATGQARYGEVKIIDSGTIARIEQSRSVGGSRIWHNKVTYFLNDFGKNYIAHFTPSFLFLDGGDNYQFSVPGHGLIYKINFLFLLLGVIYLIKNHRAFGKSSLVILFWLLVAPIPASLTREAPHVLRAITLLPIPMLISALGLISILRKFKFPTLFLYAVILVISGLMYLNTYFNVYAKAYSWSWQYGYKDMVGYVRSHYASYDKILITKRYGEPHEFLLFYMQIDPESYRSDKNLNRFYQTNWYWVDSFDKFYFVNDWQVNENGKGEYVFNLESKKQITCPLGAQKCLLITSPGNVPAGWTKIYTIDFADDRPAFEIYENK